MSTKERILEAALLLFNRDGISNVSLRRIAKEAGIHIGNLTYYFPNRDSLIEALLNELLNELENKIERVQESKESLRMLWRILYTSCRIQLRYRFIMIDLLQMLRKYPGLLERFRINFDRRRKEIAYALQLLEISEELNPELHPGYYQYYLLPQMYCLNDFWISESELMYEWEQERKADYYASITFSLLLPHLSEKGKVSYFNILDRLK